jgi:hypothetical protein
MLTGIISILGGIIAASSYIVSKKANAKELIDKLIPYQGWIGVVLLFWSIKNVLRLLNYFNGYTLLFAVAQFIVGFLLAYGLLSQYLFKNSEEAIEKGQQLRVKLVQYQVPAGVGLIVLGVLRLIQWL